MSVRAKQWLIVGAGALVAAVMLLLGLWQMQVFVDQGNRSAQARAQQPPVPLLDNVGSDGSVGDIYGKQVTVRGHYLPGQDLMVIDAAGRIRLLAAFQVPDGRVLPVVRGSLASRTIGQPNPPSGEVLQGGIFLPSEPGSDHATPDGTLGSVRLPRLAQMWPQPLLPGFLTLSEADSKAQGLTPAAVTLPTEEGSWRNGGYALQWWVFAAFAIGMAVMVARSVGRRALAAREAALAASSDSSGGEAAG